MSTQRSLLVILRHAPYGSQNSRDGLDLALTFAAFEQPVSLLLLDDACYLLKSDQAPEALGQKNTAKLCQALPMYDIDQVYLDQDCAKHRGLNSDNCVLPYQSIDAEGIRQLIAQHHQVIQL